jgi:hypothetical protein
MSQSNLQRFNVRREAEPGYKQNELGLSKPLARVRYSQRECAGRDS